MPVATSMESPGPDPVSPASRTTTKAAFFRARSPPIVDRPSPGPRDLSARFTEPRPRNGEYSLDQSIEDQGVAFRNGTAGHGHGHGPVLESFGQPRLSRPPLTPSSPQARLEMNRNGYVHYEGQDEMGEETSPQSARMGITGGSDEMLMSLLAGQAAVDCETLPVGGWEEVESWKKVCFTCRHPQSMGTS